MSCATKAGVVWALNAIKEVHGQKITQGTWHHLRAAAFASPGAVPSRARADGYEIISAVDGIAKANNFCYEDGSEIKKRDIRAEAIMSVGKTTKSTCQVISFMCQFDMKEIIETAQAASNTAQTKCGKCSSPRPKTEWKVEGDNAIVSCGECGAEIARCSRKQATQTAGKRSPPNSAKGQFSQNESGDFSCHLCGQDDVSYFYPAKGDGFPTHGLDPLWDRQTYLCGKCHSINWF